MKATITDDGTVTITYNAQCETLYSPYGQPHGENRLLRKYIPCAGGCGQLLTNNLNVISFTCAECAYGHVEAEANAPTT